MKTELHFLWISVFLRMKNISDESCRENRNTHFWSSRTFCFKNRAVYEILWKNTVEPNRLQMTIWSIHIACWILNTQNVILIAFPLKQCLYECASILCYTYSACLVSLNWVIRGLPCIYFLNYLLCNSMHLHQNTSQQTIHTVLL